MVIVVFIFILLMVDSLIKKLNIMLVLVDWFKIKKLGLLLKFIDKVDLLLLISFDYFLVS